MSQYIGVQGQLCRQWAVPIDRRNFFRVVTPPADKGWTAYQSVHPHTQTRFRWGCLNEVQRVVAIYRNKLKPRRIAHVIPIPLVWAPLGKLAQQRFKVSACNCSPPGPARYKLWDLRLPFRRVPEPFARAPSTMNDRGRQPGILFHEIKVIDEAVIA